MAEDPDLRSIVEAAEQSAATGDYSSAERLLRQAALLQETQLGPLHPDLANTLNNLGIVCESAGKPADAEDCYRRAYAIATSVLEPEDPLVVTSGQNLRDFCEVSGRPFELSASAPDEFAPEEPAAVGTSPSTAAHEAAAPDVLLEPSPMPSETARPAPAAGPGRLVIGVGVIAGLSLVALVMSGSWFGSDESSSPDTASTSAPSTAAPEPSPAPSPVEPVPARAAPAAEKPAAVPPARRVPPAPAQAGVTLVDARVCRTLSTRDWRCTSTPDPADPGLFFFYTRVKSVRDTTVRHRWYYEGTLLRDVPLRIGANPDTGYRTYSRNTVIAERAGNWRVELWSPDGRVLHEERFVVR